jgi:endonuclease G
MGGIWGHVQDGVFEDTDVENLKVSVLGGPVFRDYDREFRRVIVFIENQKVKSKGFLLRQSLDELEAFDLDEFKVFQVALTEIEARCGLSFPAALKAADAVRERLRLQPEALSQRRPPVSLRDIDWS